MLGSITKRGVHLLVINAARSGSTRPRASPVNQGTSDRCLLRSARSAPRHQKNDCVRQVPKQWEFRHVRYVAYLKKYSTRVPTCNHCRHHLAAYCNQATPTGRPISPRQPHNVCCSQALTITYKDTPTSSRNGLIQLEDDMSDII